MSGAWPTMYGTNVVTASPALAAETVIATLNNITLDNATRRVFLAGWAAWTVGTSGTAARFRLRRDSLTGTAVTGGDTGAVTVVAANLRSDFVFGIDVPGELTGATYVLTLIVTAGAAASTVSSVFLGATITN